MFKMQYLFTMVLTLYECDSLHVWNWIRDPSLGLNLTISGKAFSFGRQKNALLVFIEIKYYPLLSENEDSDDGSSCTSLNLETKQLTKLFWSQVTLTLKKFGQISTWKNLKNEQHYTKELINQLQFKWPNFRIPSIRQAKINYCTCLFYNNQCMPMSEGSPLAVARFPQSILNDMISLTQ